MAYINGKKILNVEMTGLVNIDTEMSDTSENPVQNKVVKEYVDKAIANAGGSITVDQFYDRTSENAQSGKAVAEAVEQLMPKVLPACSEWYDQILVIKDIQHDENGELSYKYSTFPIDQQHEYTSGGLEEPYCIPIRNYNACLTTNYPSDEYDCTNKAYVDGLVGDIETLLGGI